MEIYMKKSAVLRSVKAVTAMVTAIVISLTALAPCLPAKAMSAEDDAFFYLTDTLGFNVAAACGIMANIRHESNFHPGRSIQRAASESASGPAGAAGAWNPIATATGLIMNPCTDSCPIWLTS